MKPSEVFAVQSGIDVCDAIDLSIYNEMLRLELLINSCDENTRIIQDQKVEYIKVLQKLNMKHNYKS